MDFAAALDDLVKNYISGKGPSVPGATVNAPGSALDAATQARLAKMRAADSAAVEAARGAAVAPPGGAPAAAPPAASPPKAGFGARAARILNPNMSQLGKVGFVAGKANAALAPAFGLLSVASGGQSEGRAFAESLGVDYNSFGGRAGTNALNFLRRTGDAATFGLAGRLGRVLSGGNFDDEEVDATALHTNPGRYVSPELLAQARAASAPADSTTVPAPATTIGFVETPPAESDLDVYAHAFMANGGGQDGSSVVRTALGPVESFGGYIEGPNGRVELPSGTVQRFGVRPTTPGRTPLARNINAARARHFALKERKVAADETDAAARRTAAGKTSAEEVIALSKVAAAQEYLRKNPGDLGGYVAMLSGKDPKETVGTIASPTGSTTLVTRDRKGITTDQAGNVVERAIYRQPSEGEVAAMKANIKDPAYKASFIRHFGPDAYKTLVESR